MRELVSALIDASPVPFVPVDDLENRFMEQLFLFTLPDMLIVVRYLISRFGFLCVVGCESFIKDHMIDLLQILVAENNVLLRPAPVYIRR